MGAGPRRAADCPVCVILLDYDGREVLGRCIDSLVGQSARPARLIFVDNGSSGFDETQVRARFGTGYSSILEIERLGENVGYAGGMNHGLRRALQGRGAPGAPLWAMTLSNDTRLDPDFFERLATRIAETGGAASFGDGPRGVGMIAAKIRAMDDPDTLDGTGLAVSLDGMSTARGQRQRDDGQFDAAERTLCPSGVAAVYRIDMLSEVGLLDEDFGAYCEDTDLGLRAWLEGWDCVFAPECVVYHARSSTLGEHSLKKLFLVERNHFWVALKNLPLPLLAFNPALTGYRCAIQAYALLARRGQGRGYGQGHPPLALLETTLRAWLDAGRGAPRAFRKRLAARQSRRRSLADQLRLFWEDRLPFSDLILK